MKKLFEWISGIFSKSSDTSSKRVFGGIGFICSIVIIWLRMPDMTNELLYVSASLLGLGILDKIAKK